MVVVVHGPNPVVRNTPLFVQCRLQLFLGAERSFHGNEAIGSYATHRIERDNH